MSDVRVSLVPPGSFAGPGTDAQWEHVLPDLEAFTVLVHPRKPEMVLAGTSDGVWRSSDHGKTFTRTSFPDTGKQVWSFLVDAGDPNLVYAGGSPVDIYRSEDCGEHWRKMPSPGIPDRATAPFAVRVMRFAQHPSKPQEIYAALEVNGVIRTTDGGETWEDCSEDLLRLSETPHLRSKIVSDTFAEGMLDGHAIATTSADPESVLLAVRTGLFRSCDQGRSWQDLEVGRFSPFTYGRDLRVSPSNPKVLFAALSVAAASHEGALYRSDDVGQTWSRFDKVHAHGTLMSIALHPQDAEQVYIAARYNGEVFGTTDNGATWQEMPLPHGVKDIYCLACG